MHDLQLLTDTKITIEPTGDSSIAHISAQNAEAAQDARDILLSLLSLLTLTNSQPSSRAFNNYTHFVSIPLGQAQRVAIFRDWAQKTQPRLDSHALVSPQRLHLTVAMLSLPSKTNLQRAIVALQSLAGHNLEPLSVSIRGLDIMKGTASKCRVLHAKIEPNRKLDELGRRVQIVLAKAGLVHDLRPARWHATLINTRHTATNAAFDATPLLHAPPLEVVDFGSVSVDCLHLSSLYDPLDSVTGYYHCKHKVLLNRH